MGSSSPGPPPARTTCSKRRSRAFLPPVTSAPARQSGAPPRSEREHGRSSSYTRTSRQAQRSDDPSRPERAPRSRSNLAPMAVKDSPEISDAPDRDRYELSVDGQTVGFTEYRARPGLIAFLHTEIDERVQGRGLGD